MNGRGTQRNQQVETVLCVVLLFVLLAATGGCRDGETEPAPAQARPFNLSFAAGDQFVYDTWALDQRYPQLPQAKTESSWRVLKTGEVYQGVSGVTVIVDSADTGGGRSVRDTLYLASSPGGDLFIYGFLARIVKQRSGTNLRPRWDPVASFSTGTTGTWTVGATDSAGKEMVYGSISGASDYYSASVNGVTEVFPTYRVDLAGPTLYCSLWFANAPNAIVRLLEEPDFETDGMLREIVAIRTAAR